MAEPPAKRPKWPSLQQVQCLQECRQNLLPIRIGLEIEACYTEQDFETTTIDSFEFYEFNDIGMFTNVGDSSIRCGGTGKQVEYIVKYDTKVMMQPTPFALRDQERNPLSIIQSVEDMLDDMEVLVPKITKCQINEQSKQSTCGTHIHMSCSSKTIEDDPFLFYILQREWVKTWQDNMDYGERLNNSFSEKNTNVLNAAEFNLDHQRALNLKNCTESSSGPYFQIRSFAILGFDHVTDNNLTHKIISLVSRIQPLLNGKFTNFYPLLDQILTILSLQDTNKHFFYNVDLENNIININYSETREYHVEFRAMGDFVETFVNNEKFDRGKFEKYLIQLKDFFVSTLETNSAEYPFTEKVNLSGLSLINSSPICRTIFQNKSLKTIDLSNNNFTFKSITGLLRIVANSEHLTTLHLRETYFHPALKISFLEVFLKNTTVEIFVTPDKCSDLVDNFTCIKIENSKLVFMNESKDIDKEICQEKMKKLKDALSNRK